MSEDIVEDQETPTQPEKTFSQADIDRIVTDRVGREQRKFESMLSGIDIDEAKKLIKDKDAAEVERQKSRGEFDVLLKSTVDKKDLEIKTLQGKLHTTLIDGALISAASSSNAVDPSQVSALLRSNLRLSPDGSVEVLDSNGTPRYNDKGNVLTTGEFVAEFLTANPHHVKASQGGSGSQGRAGGNGSQVKSKSRAEFEQLNAVERASFMKSGGTLT